MTLLDPRRAAGPASRPGLPPSGLHDDPTFPATCVPAPGRAPPAPRLCGAAAQARSDAGGRRGASLVAVGAPLPLTEPLPSAAVRDATCGAAQDATRSTPEQPVFGWCGFDTARPHAAPSSRAAAAPPPSTHAAQPAARCGGAAQAGRGLVLRSRDENVADDPPDCCAPPASAPWPPCAAVADHSGGGARLADVEGRLFRLEAALARLLPSSTSTHTTHLHHTAPPPPPLLPSSGAWHSAFADTSPPTTAHCSAPSSFRSPSVPHVLRSSFDPLPPRWSPRRVAHCDAPGAALCVALSPDGLLAAAGGTDKLISIWDAPSGALICRLKGHSKAVTCVAVACGGAARRRVASGSDDRTLRLWSPPCLAAAATLLGHSRAVVCVAFSPDGTTLASGGADASLKLWDVGTGARLGVVVGGSFAGAGPCPPVFVPHHAREISCVSFSHDGRVICAGSADGRLSMWCASSGALLAATPQGHAREVLAVAFVDNGTRVASVGGDVMLRVFWAANGEQISATPLSGGAVHAAAFGPGSGAASGLVNKHKVEPAVVTAGGAGAGGGGVALWGVYRGSRARVLAPSAAGAYCTAFAGNGGAVAVGDADGGVTLWAKAA